jgi:hypothetical protein
MDAVCEVDVDSFILLAKWARRILTLRVIPDLLVG